MNSQEISITVSKTLELITKLIETKQGDPGRLRYIFESLQKGKPLFKTDQSYIERKIHAQIIIEPPKSPSKREDLIKSIKRLIDWKAGDPGRLRYMFSTVSKGNQLFKTDQKYLEIKLKTIKRGTPRTRQEPKQKPSPKTMPKFEEIKPQESTITLDFVNHLKTDLKEARENISKLKIELGNAHEIIRHLELKIIRQKQELQNLKEGKVSETYEVYDNSELREIGQKISQEEKRIHKQKAASDELKQQRIKLNQLISYREEYEKRVDREKEILDQHIKEENQRIAKKDKLVDNLTKKQDEIKRSRAEREIILEQIKLDQKKLEDELSRQKRELEKSKKEYDDLVKRDQNENSFDDKTEHKKTKNSTEK